MIVKSEERISIRHLPIEELRPDPANPRRIKDSEMESLTRSLQEFGFVQPPSSPPGGRGGAKSLCRSCSNRAIYPSDYLCGFGDS